MFKIRRTHQLYATGLCVEGGSKFPSKYYQGDHREDYLEGGLATGKRGITLPVEFLAHNCNTVKSIRRRVDQIYMKFVESRNFR